MDDLLGSFTNIRVTPDEFELLTEMAIDDSEKLGYREDKNFKNLLKEMHKNMQSEVDASEDDEDE